MKRYSQRSGHTAMAELNVTPLLDLAFVLLIIFIITTPLLESSIPLNLPSAPSNNTQAPDSKSIRTVSIDKTGRVYLESQPVELAALEQKLITFHRDTPDAAVVIRGDKSTRLQQLVDVLAILQRAQITRMQIIDVAP